MKGTPYISILYFMAQGRDETDKFQKQSMSLQETSVYLDSYQVALVKYE